MLVGRVGRAHGTRGAVVVDPHTDDPLRRFAPGSRLALEDGTELVVTRFEATERSPVVSFAGIDDRSTAEGMRGAGLYIAATDRRPLARDEYWPDELVGLAVVDREGHQLGTVSDVETGLSQDRLIVDTGDGSFMVPLVSALVPTVDVNEGRIVVDLPAGFTGDVTD